MGNDAVDVVGCRSRVGSGDWLGSRMPWAGRAGVHHSRASARFYMATDLDEHVGLVRVLL